jgi:outer membrane receptor protein involved in Fe transport
MHLINNRTSRLTALIALGAAALYAQGTQTGSITGEVLLKGGKPASGANITVTSPSLQGTRSTVADANGRFVLRLLPPGVYTLTLVKEGFQTIKITEKIGIDQNFQPRFEMTTTSGAVVEVIAASVATDKTDVKSAANYTAEAIDRLPTGRTMDLVALLTPGVTVGVGGRTQIRGAMTTSNLMLVDGQNVQDNAYATNAVTVINDSVEEFQIITGAISAEYGSVDGGVMNTLTKSGSNTFSGMVRLGLSNAQWDAVAPLQSRAGISNTLGKTETYGLGGPILKDKLWFYASYYRTRSDLPFTYSNATPGGNPFGNTSDARHDSEQRRQIKLSYQITENHQVVYSFMNGRTDVLNRNTRAAEPDATYDGLYTNQLSSLSWRAAWSNTTTSEIKYGAKKQVLNAGGRYADRDRMFDYDTTLSWQSGPWKGPNAGGAGDHRDNESFNVKVSFFFNALGSHQLDTGYDFYRGTVRAKNEQSASDYIIGIYGVNGVNRTAFGSDIWTYQYTEGKAVNDQTGLYVNDKWSINNNISVQIGLRYDTYKAKKEDGSRTAGASGLSPRLGMKYDLFGDSKWIFGASYAKYNGKVLEGITNQVTGQGNPTEIDYAYIGPEGRQSFAVLSNHANYDMTPGGITYYGNPTLNVKLSDNLKAPTTEEKQISASYTFQNPSIGTGYVKLTAVQRDWKNLFDYQQGNQGTVQDAAGQDHYYKVWVNSSVATREYKGLEFDSQLTTGPWSLTAGITWSSLKGNYEGEGTSTPGRGEGLEAWTIVDGVQKFDSSVVAPYGYLTGHVPLRMRGSATRSLSSEWGTTSVGIIYRFDTGSRLSDTRNISPARLGLTGAAASDAGTVLTQYNGRGTRVMPAESYMDLAITHDFPLAVIKGTKVNTFAKLVITNVWNHQQVISLNNLWNSATGTYNVANQGINSPWVPSAGNGTPNSTLNFGLPRQFTLAAGVRF